MPETPDQTLKDRLERAASRVLANSLGLEVDDDGKVDPNEIDKSALQEHSREIVLGMLRAYYIEMQAFREEQGEVDPDEDDTPKPPIDVAFRDWSDAKSRSFSGKLHETLGLPLDERGILDIEALEDDEARTQIAQRLFAFANTVGKTVEDLRNQASPFVTALEARTREIRRNEAAERSARPKVDPAPQPATSSDTDDDEVLSDEDADDATDWDNVIDFDAWKENRFSGAAKLGKSLQQTLNQLLEGKLAQTEDGGQIRLNIDEAFVQEHLPSLIKKAIENIVPPKIDITLPMAEDEAEPVAPSAKQDATDTAAATTAEDDDGPLKLSLNVDFGGLFRTFFKTTPPAEADTE